MSVLSKIQKFTVLLEIQTLYSFALNNIMRRRIRLCSLKRGEEEQFESYHFSTREVVVQCKASESSEDKQQKLRNVNHEVSLLQTSLLCLYMIHSCL